MKRPTRSITQTMRPALFASATRADDIGAGLQQTFHADADDAQDMAQLDLSRAALDDLTTAYVLAMQPPFDLLRHAAAQLAGLMILTASGARNVAAHPMLDKAISAQAQAEDGLHARDGNVPPRAEHHRRHVLRANGALAVALKAAVDGAHRNDPVAIDAILVPLRTAYRELQWAASALPGFEVVALWQGCCAGHASSRANGRKEAQQ